MWVSPYLPEPSMLISELNMTRRMGCEFEMTVPRLGTGDGADVQRSIADCLNANGIRAVARPYQQTHVPIDCDVAVEHDSSVEGESLYRSIHWHPIEVKTRILRGTEDWESVVPKTLAICRYLGARVNRTCGHHIHMDFPEVNDRLESIRSVYNLMHRYEPVIYGLLAPSRSLSGYARPMDHRPRLFHGSPSYRKFRKALEGWHRQSGLNLTHLFKPIPRIEFRYHQGTLDPTKARHWMRLVNRLVEHAVTRSCQAANEQVPNSRKGIESLRYTIGLRSNAGIYPKVQPELSETGRYWLQRWKHFQPSSSGED